MREYLKNLFLPKSPREWETLKFLRPLLRPTDIFVDVGASVGLFKTYLSPYVKVFHEIEPRNDGIAMGDFDGECNFYLNRRGGWSGFYPQPGVTKQIRVKVRRLDSVFSKIDVLKVDVEGAEFRVLEGLGDIRPRVICVEIYPDRYGFDFNAFEELVGSYENHQGVNYNMVFWSE